MGPGAELWPDLPANGRALQLLDYIGHDEPDMGFGLAFCALGVAVNDGLNHLAMLPLRLLGHPGKGVGEKAERMHLPVVLAKEFYGVDVLTGLSDSLMELVVQLSYFPCVTGTKAGLHFLQEGQKEVLKVIIGPLRGERGRQPV